MRLSDGKAGNLYKVNAINLSTPAKRRLEILGMTGNAQVAVLNSKKSGTKIIKVRGTRFALGKEFADGIEVEVKG
jgi:ferrous iron transport protein A